MKDTVTRQPGRDTTTVATPEMNGVSVPDYDPVCASAGTPAGLSRWDACVKRSLDVVGAIEDHDEATGGGEQGVAGGEQGARVRTRSNRHGGMLGGISSGMPIVLRCAIKPTSSLPREQETVTRAGEATTIATKGRHDPCLLPRFVPMGEAMMALVLADHMLRQRVARG